MTTTPSSPSPTQVPLAAAEAQPERGMQWLSSVVFLLVALIGVLIVLYAWRLPPFSSAIVSTENALVRGQVTIVGTQLSGYVVAVKVQDFQRVKQGDLLVLIDDRIYQQRYDQARAQLAAQQAALANWQQSRNSALASVDLQQAALANAQAQALKSAADLGRVDRLAADGSLSLREQDASKASKAQTVAAVAQARASVDIARQAAQTVVVKQAALNAAKVDLDNTRITAPVDGQLGQVSVRLGAYVNAGAQLMGIVPPQMWVIANLKETQMNHVQVGQGATFKVDALDGAMLTGQVEHISPATGSEFSVLPPDNATGNYVKVAQRIPVRIRIDAGQAQARRLRPGMSVEVSIDTSTLLNDAARAPASAPVAPAAAPRAGAATPSPASASTAAGTRP